MSRASSSRNSNSPNGSDVLSQSQISNPPDEDDVLSQRSNSPNESDEERQMSQSPEGSDDSEPDVNRKEIVTKLVWRKIEKVDTKLDENGEYCENLLEALQEIDSNISANYEDGSEEDEEVRNEICRFLATKSKVVDICCDLIIQYNKTHETMECFKSRSVNICLNLLSNMTDGSEEISKRVANYQNLLETVKLILENSVALIKDGKCYGDEEDEEKADEDEEKADEDEEEKGDEEENDGGPRDYLTLVYSLSLSDTCIARLRRLGFLEIFKTYLDFEMESMSKLALFALASIVSEEDAKFINANRKSVRDHLDVLKSSLEQECHRYCGWSRVELARVLRMLARNDANKRLLFDLDVFEPLVSLADDGNYAEKKESTGVIWALCFDPVIRKKVVSDEDFGVVDLLKKLSDCGDKSVEGNCKGALWTLREDLQKSSVGRYREISGDAPKTETQRGGSTADTHDERKTIMISYQWNDQDTIKKISNELKQNNFKVWLDIECMGGSTLGAMAGAVDEANVVLICYSEKYKNSSNCRAEADYAFTKKKTIIPLKMEHGYNPDGWLGMLIGSRLYFEFSKMKPFKEKMKELLKEVGNVCNINKGEKGTAARKKDESSAKSCHLL